VLGWVWVTPIVAALLTLPFVLNDVSGWVAVTAIVAGVLTLPVAAAALKEKLDQRTRKRRLKQNLPVEPRRPLPKSLTEAFKANRVATVSYVLSVAFVIATAVLIITDCVGGKVTTLALTFTYIAGAMFEVIGIWVTVDEVLVMWDGTARTAEGWSRLRGPLFIVTGILLGLVGNIASLHMQPHSVQPVVSVAGAVQVTRAAAPAQRRSQYQLSATYRLPRVSTATLLGAWTPVNVSPDCRGALGHSR
jgi:hypothetical protein